MDWITATYRATRPDRPAEALARAIALEQSLEASQELLSPEIEAAFAGRVRAVEAEGDETALIRIDYPLVAEGFGLTTLLQTVYGNVSFYPRIRLVGLALPDRAWSVLPKPRLGIGRLRANGGRSHGPLLGTVLKPRGLSATELARRARGFAAGGGDFLKDDQNLVNDFDGFRARTSAVREAVEAGAAARGAHCRYWPHASGAGSELERKLGWAADQGFEGVVLCGFVLGLESAAAAAAAHGLAWMCHPAMAGTWTEPPDNGIAPAVLFGTIVRAAGADICNFPVSGGRVAPREAADTEIVSGLLQAIPDRPTVLPCLAGGVTVDRLESLAERFGPDCMLLVGSDLMRSGDGIEAATARAREAIERTPAPPLPPLPPLPPPD